MKKYVNLAFVYAIIAMIGGIFYREFTKFNDFTEDTTLAVVHLHLFVLGTIVFLLIAIFSHITDLNQQKTFKYFFKLYNIGLPFMTIMFLIRGITQVLAINLSNSASHAISGIAGISHIIMGVAIVLLFISLRKSSLIKEKVE